MATRILALVGSLRSASVSRRLAETAATVAPEGVEVAVYDGLGEVPFYNEDLDDHTAPLTQVHQLRTAAAQADALLLVTPEYNGSIPAVLKNAIDWLSRPYGAGAISGKPVAVVSASPTPYGAAWAQQHTIQAVKIAGGQPVDAAHLSIPATMQKFGSEHPSQHTEVAGQLAATVRELHATTGALLSA